MCYSKLIGFYCFILTSTGRFVIGVALGSGPQSKFGAGTTCPGLLRFGKIGFEWYFDPLPAVRRVGNEEGRDGESTGWNFGEFQFESMNGSTESSSGFLAPMSSMEVALAFNSGFRRLISACFNFWADRSAFNAAAVVVATCGVILSRDLINSERPLDDIVMFVTDVKLSRAILDANSATSLSCWSMAISILRYVRLRVSTEGALKK
jgi:hypothetical protein